MYRILTLVLALGLVADLAAQPADPVVRGDLGAEIDAYMSQMEARGYSGGLVVAKDGEVVLMKGYGLADQAAGVPFSTQTIFTVGSIAKQFTAAAILKLEEQGKLGVQDPITKYFDGVPADKQGIRLHHLLTHSAGFPGAIGYDFAPTERDDYIREALAAELEFEPGEGYEYSNVGFSLLAAIIEQVSGQSYDAYAYENLFKPAGMESTGYAKTRLDGSALAHGYRGGEDWGTFFDKPYADDGPYWHLRGNGGILTTLPDMLRWHQALESDAVLSDASKEKLYTRHVREMPGQPYFYGYGWTITDTPHGTVIMHNGGNPYFSSDFVRYVDEDVMIFITANTNEHRAFRHTEAISAIVFGEPYELPPEGVEVDDIEVGDERGLEETAVGRHALAMLEALATPGEASARKFFVEHYAPQVFEEEPLDDLVAEFRRDQEEIGAVEIGKIIQGGPRRLTLTVRSKNSGAWWQLNFVTLPEAPHLLRGHGVQDAQPPDMQPPSAPAPAAIVTSADCPEDWGLPGSPTGRASSAFLSTICSGEEAAFEQFIDEWMAEDFRKAFPREEHLGHLRRMHETMGDAEFESAMKTGATEASLVVKRRRDGQRFTIKIAHEPAAPHGINMISVEEADSGGSDSGGSGPNAPDDTPPSAAPSGDAEIAQALEDYLQDLADRGAFSGAVLLAKDGQVLFERAYGLADREQGTPNRVDTKFNLGSMNKMFTAVAIAQLAEKGLLSFDDPILRHLPDYPNRAAAEQVTIHHLLTHTSGLGFYPFEHGARTPAGILPFFAEAPLAFEPGSQMQYSNAGFAVLGLVIERVSGEDYYDYLRRHVFAPAGMTDTDSYAQDEAVPNRAIGYTRRDSDTLTPNTGMLEIKGSPAGGGYSTLRDMLRFGEALKNHTLLGPEMTEVLLEGKVEMGPGMRYAYGFGDRRVGGHRNVGHNGGAPGVGADFKVYLDQGYTTVLFTNYDAHALRPVAQKLSAWLGG